VEHLAEPLGTHNTGVVAIWLIKEPSAGLIFDEDIPLVVAIEEDTCKHLIIGRDGEEISAKPALKVLVGLSMCLINPNLDPRTLTGVRYRHCCHVLRIGLGGSYHIKNSLGSPNPACALGIGDVATFWRRVAEDELCVPPPGKVGYRPRRDALPRGIHSSCARLRRLVGRRSACRKKAAGEDEQATQQARKDQSFHLSSFPLL